MSAVDEPGDGADRNDGSGLDLDLSVGFDSFEVVVAFAVPAGTVTAVLGPNGAGKTTVLRALAGFLPLDRGSIRLGGRLLDEPRSSTFVVPERRRVALVHQDLLLFPHLSVVDNVAFAARGAGASRADSRRAARSWLDRVGLADRADDRPGDLSGGQAQRVALARALAAEPELLLLDEPLSSLDVGTRATVRRDLRRYLDDFAGATVLVTHDPLDALVLADDVVIVEAGRVSQAGPVAEVTSRPRSRYVADLIGTNLVRGTADGRTVRAGSAVVELAEPADGDTFVTIAPSAIALYLDHPTGSPRNAWAGRVEHIERLGERVRVQISGPLPLVAEVTPASVAALGIQVGTEVWAGTKATEVRSYPA